MTKLFFASQGATFGFIGEILYNIYFIYDSVLILSFCVSFTYKLNRQIDCNF